MSPSPEQIVADNFKRLMDDIGEACQRAGRAASDVQIVGVSKYVDAAATQWLVDAGCSHLGESRPQQLAAKAKDDALTGDIHWHLVGHLQRNKVELTLGCEPLIHSVDSERLLRAIDKAATKQGKPARILLEVNTSGDAEKHGLIPDELPKLLDLASECQQTNLLGLMTMAARTGGPDVARQNFASLRDLLQQVQASHPQLGLRELSMGMSGDFAQAIAEGATIVRVGSRLWEGLDNAP